MGGIPTNNRFGSSTGGGVWDLGGVAGTVKLTGWQDTDVLSEDALSGAQEEINAGMADPQGALEWQGQQLSSWQAPPLWRSFIDAAERDAHLIPLHLLPSALHGTAAGGLLLSRPVSAAVDLIAAGGLFAAGSVAGSAPETELLKPDPQPTHSHYLPARGRVFHNGKLLKAKITERIGDNVLIEARGYEGPTAWRVQENGDSVPAKDVYFPESQKLVVAEGYVKDTRTLLEDRNYYLLEDRSPSRAVQPQFVIKVDQTTGGVERVENYFFMDDPDGILPSGDYFSSGTGLHRALIVEGDLFSAWNKDALYSLQDYPSLGFILLDNTDGQALRNRIYPDPQRRKIFWVTDSEGRAKKVEANRIGKGPFYIFTIPQEIERDERLFDGSGDVDNVFVYMRKDGETRRATTDEIKALAAQHIGRKIPSLESPKKVDVVEEKVPIRAKGKKRIKKGFSWRVRITGNGLDRTIEVKIEASSIKYAEDVFDYFLKISREMPADLFKTVKIVEIYKGPSIKYGFREKKNIGGQYDHGTDTCSLFKEPGWWFPPSLRKALGVGPIPGMKRSLTHELVHSLTKDKDKERVLLAIAADGIDARDKLFKAKPGGDYAGVAWSEWVAEAGAEMVFGRRKTAPSLFDWAKSTSAVLAHMLERPIDPAEKREGIVSNPPAPAKEKSQDELTIKNKPK